MPLNWRNDTKSHMELIGQWQQAADLMYFGYDASRGLTKQDDEFLEQSVWPFEETPAANYRFIVALSSDDNLQTSSLQTSGYRI